MLAAVIENPSALQYVSSKFNSNREFVLDAMKQNPKVLQYVKNKDFVLEAVKESGSAFRYASFALKGDQEFVLNAVEKNTNVMLWVGRFKDSEEFVLAAAKKNPFVLEHVENKEFVLAAVTQNPLVLQYVKNKDFVLAAVTQNPSVFQYVSEDMISVLVGKINDKAYDGRFKLRNAILLFLQNYNIDLTTREKLAAICLEKVEPVCFSRRRRNILSAAEKIRREFENKNVVKKGQRNEQEGFENEKHVEGGDEKRGRLDGRDIS